MEGQHCLEHLSLEELEAVVARLRAGEPLDARDTKITRERLRALLDELRDAEGRVALPAVDLRGTTFTGFGADFGETTFGGYANFGEATFSGEAQFGKATFSADVNFGGATFTHTAAFDGAVFTGKARFGDATFTDMVRFTGATFCGEAEFSGRRPPRGSGAAVFMGYAIFERATFSSNVAFGGATFSDDANFGGATFSGHAGFGEAAFHGHTYWGEATFSGDAGFEGGTFSEDANFGGATFSGDGLFGRSTFSRAAGFDRATFSGYTLFGGATFSGDAVFDEATFSGEALFGGATFSGVARFQGATFGKSTVFRRATFSGALELGRASFERDAVFESVAFEHVRELGPFVVAGRAVLDGSVFAERVRIAVAACVLSARSTTFAGGALLHIRWAEIALDEADFARPSTLSSTTSWPNDHDLEPACLVDDRHLQLDPRPRLMTLRGAQAASLSLANVDLRACRFFGAHGLESLSIEASCLWPRPPARWGRLDRETIAEEHALRGWQDPVTQPSQWLAGREDSEPLKAGQVAALYRALRKAREDDKDEAGAGDLYYGEMEMRRHARSTGSRWRQGNVVILWLYWLISGYGLRPARALVALALVILLGAGVLSQWGFHDPQGDIHPHGYGRSLMFALESALSVLRQPERAMSAGGEMTQIALRLLGPLLFALALLAIRARVKR